MVEPTLSESDLWRQQYFDQLAAVDLAEDRAREAEAVADILKQELTEATASLRAVENRCQRLYEQNGGDTFAREALAKLGGIFSIAHIDGDLATIPVSALERAEGIFAEARKKGILSTEAGRAMLEEEG